MSCQAGSWFTNELCPCNVSYFHISVGCTLVKKKKKKKIAHWTTRVKCCLRTDKANQLCVKLTCTCVLIVCFASSCTTPLTDECFHSTSLLHTHILSPADGATTLRSLDRKQLITQARCTLETAFVSHYHCSLMKGRRVNNSLSINNSRTFKCADSFCRRQ